MNSKDPFNGLDIEQISNLPEPQFRYYIAHKLSLNEKVHEGIKRDVHALVKRPERTLAKAAIVGSLIASICAVMALFISVVR